jgi:predicted nucleic acid-binding Zn ribbon protein
MILCAFCGEWPITGNQKRYCSDLCYQAAKKIRERRKNTPPKPTEMIRTCLGPCGRPFMSMHKYNRVCSRCSRVMEKFVPINGM